MIGNTIGAARAAMAIASRQNGSGRAASALFEEEILGDRQIGAQDNS